MGHALELVARLDVESVSVNTEEFARHANEVSCDIGTQLCDRPAESTLL